MGSVSFLQPCEICGNNTGSPTGRCNACWTIERGLEEFLSHPGGRAAVRSILDLIGEELEPSSLES